MSNIDALRNEYALAGLAVNRAEALQLAYLKRSESNLARSYIELHDELSRLRSEVEGAREACRRVIDTFEKDEAQGYHSPDRRYAIDVLKIGLRSLSPSHVGDGTTTGDTLGTSMTGDQGPPMPTEEEVTEAIDNALYWGWHKNVGKAAATDAARAVLKLFSDHSLLSKTEVKP